MARETLRSATGVALTALGSEEDKRAQRPEQI